MDQHHARRVRLTKSVGLTDGTAATVDNCRAEGFEQPDQHPADDNGRTGIICFSLSINASTLVRL
jgi:hypothetical protein